jgi:hypothetical protein
MNPPIITNRTSRRHIREMDGQTEATALAECTDLATQQHTITIPYRASTKTRLHEIAHCELKHCIIMHSLKTMSIDQYIEQEIDAEEWAFSRCGKRLSIEAVLNHAYSVIVHFHRKPSYVFNACIKALAKHGYKLDREQRSELWRKCREFEKERRNSY